MNSEHSKHQGLSLTFERRWKGESGKENRRRVWRVDLKGRGFVSSGSSRESSGLFESLLDLVSSCYSFEELRPRQLKSTDHVHLSISTTRS